MRIKIEVKPNEKDKRAIEAFTQYFKLFTDDRLLDLWEAVKKCNFRNHIVGKGGHHIWLARKDTNTRIAIITD